MVSSSDTSSPVLSSFFGEVFSVFSLREESFYSLGLPILLRMSGEGKMSVLSFRNSLPQEHLWEVPVRYFVSLEVEIVVPRHGDNIIH